MGRSHANKSPDRRQGGSVYYLGEGQNKKKVTIAFATLSPTTRRMRSRHLQAGFGIDPQFHSPTMRPRKQRSNRKIPKFSIKENLVDMYEDNHDDILAPSPTRTARNKKPQKKPSLRKLGSKYSQRRENLTIPN